MSVLTTLALIVASFVKPRPHDVEITELKAQIEELKREREDWRRLAEAWRDRYFAADPKIQRAQEQARQLMALEWCNCVPARHDMLLPR